MKKKKIAIVATGGTIAGSGVTQVKQQIMKQVLFL